MLVFSIVPIGAPEIGPGHVILGPTHPLALVIFGDCSQLGSPYRINKKDKHQLGSPYRINMANLPPLIPPDLGVMSPGAPPFLVTRRGGRRAQVGFDTC